MDITQAIREFLVPGQKNNNANLDRYPKEYLGLKVDLSFGLGMPSSGVTLTGNDILMTGFEGSF